MPGTRETSGAAVCVAAILAPSSRSVGARLLPGGNIPFLARVRTPKIKLSEWARVSPPDLASSRYPKTRSGLRFRSELKLSRNWRVNGAALSG